MIYEKFEDQVRNLIPPDNRDFETKEEFLEALRNHARQIQKIERVDFKYALFKEFEVELNPKAELCFDIAWQDGHACGLSEVECHFTRLVDLIN
jgi:hypothetical protein